ncbi:MAG: RecX family transcriptional regulator [Bacteroidetes bacterium]|nr:RecX family transcriptional regulator [Bacteroidota bacterium]MCL5025535.1 RecX family transcriptional regulator [Chloroflexota bacterium]
MEIEVAGTVTALKEGRRGQVEVFLDGALALRLTPLVAAGAGLHTGRFLTDEELAGLRGENEFRAALDAALSYLSYRARSEREMRDYLARREVPPEVAEAVLSRLRDLHLVDDAAFAQKWVEERQRLHPRGARALRQELRRKGVPAETVEAALPPDDAEEAYRMASRRAQRLDRSDPQAFKRRLSAYLLRRGYSYDIVIPLVTRLTDSE